ncbi:MAG: hypothetical protein WBH73_08775 [Arcanobacterium sp.]
MIQDILSYFLQTIWGASFIGSTDALQLSIADYNSTAYYFGKTINSIVVKPVAAVVVSIILVLELARVSSRFDGDSKTGVQVVATVMIKAALLIVALQNVDLILGAINEVGDNFTSNIASHVTTETMEAGDIAAADQGIVEGLASIIVLFIPWLVALVASIVVKLVVLIRFAEIYILSAAATLPLAFLGHEDTKQIAIGYLKRYATAVLHGAMLLIVIGVYSKLHIGGLEIGETDFSMMDIIQNIPSLLLGPLLLLFLTLSSGKFARALVGEG